VPSIKYRWSTRDWKLRPISRYLKSQNYPEPVICCIGISTDEIQRVNTKHYKGENYTKEFPLVDKGLSRHDCLKIILDHGWPVPPKSGCWFCPFQPIPEWNWLYLHDREKYERAKILEQNAQVRHPHVHLANAAPSLDELAKKFNHFLDEFPQEALPCKTAMCFT